MSLLLLGAGPGTDTAPYSYTNTETSDWVARCVAAGASTPNDTLKAAYDAFFTELKVVGFGTKIDFCQILFAHDEITAKQNLLSSSFAATKVGTPTFTAFAGWNGFSTSNYVNTGYQPLSGGTLLDDTQAAPNMGVGWFVQDNVQDNGNDGGNTTIRLTARDLNSIAVDSLLMRCSAATTNNVANGSITDSRGFWVQTRNSTTIYHAYKDGTEYGSSVSQASGSPGSGNLFIGVRSNAGTPENATTRRQGLVIAGTFWTGGEVTTLSNGVAALVTALGA